MKSTTLHISQIHRAGRESVELKIDNNTSLASIGLDIAANCKDKADGACIVHHFDARTSASEICFAAGLDDDSLKRFLEGQRDDQLYPLNLSPDTVRNLVWTFRVADPEREEGYVGDGNRDKLYVSDLGVTDYAAGVAPLTMTL